MGSVVTRKAERGCESQLSPEQLEASIAEIAKAGAELSRQRQQSEHAVLSLSSAVATFIVEIEPVNYEEK